MKNNRFILLYFVTLVSAKLPGQMDPSQKLKFRLCTEHKLDVMENMPKGTFVAQVKSVSYPSEVPKAIKYSITKQLGDNDPFTIDEITGVVKTNRSFNRDEPDNEHEYLVTVLAKENSNPWLYDSCVLKITITDENDNPPVFLKKIYSISVRENTRPGEELMSLAAYDIDDGENSNLTYSIFAETSKSKQLIDQYFEVNEKTGIMITKQIINKKPLFEFDFIVRAEDNGSPKQSSDINIKIRIVSSDLKLPSINEARPHSWIPEMNVPLQLNVINLTAESNILGKKELTFEILPGLTEQTNAKNTFTLKSSKNSAMIVLLGDLDYERIKRYWLVIRVTNNHNMTAETIMMVDVLDVNDNTPVFQSIGSLPIYIPEDEPPGYSVLKVNAVDADVSGIFNNITYFLGNYLGTFLIDKETGVITTLVSFEKSDRQKFDVQVYASDLVSSTLFPDALRNGEKLTISIFIMRKADNPSLSKFDSRRILMYV